MRCGADLCEGLPLTLVVRARCDPGTLPAMPVPHRSAAARLTPPRSTHSSPVPLLRALSRAVLLPPGSACVLHITHAVLTHGASVGHAAAPLLRRPSPIRPPLNTRKRCVSGMIVPPVCCSAPGSLVRVPLCCVHLCRLFACADRMMPPVPRHCMARWSAASCGPTRALLPTACSLRHTSTSKA